MKHWTNRICHKILDKVTTSIYPNIRLGNTKFKIPLIQQTGYSNLSLVKGWKYTLIKHILNNTTGSFWDFGVNTGQTLLEVKAIDTHIPYIGFEPNPICVSYLINLIQINKLDNCTIVPAASSNNWGLGKMYLNSQDKSDSAATVIQNFRETQKEFEGLLVPMINDYSGIASELIHNISLVKIDVEGAELEVIESLESILLKQKPLILCEILPVYTKENTKRLKRQKCLENRLKQAGYKLFFINKTEDSFVSLLPLDTIGINADVTQCDYLFAHPASVGSIQHLISQ